ncbi:glycosyltransferase family 9 protein [Actinotalea sp. Marseille-Q4924]|uniref:glycosyltransferase family 9 protein n=1 Tax=Actinotalea sp. Marseille-Q4924 TaxID=2866571 RepID=UPI001CE42AD6|nr:glycosyltransferase family 9 protein [Actinotalea sp. Marseille-Q4924]
MSGRRQGAGERVLVVRLDSDGDVLLAGPAVRALAADDGVAQVDLLVSPAGRHAAELLPGVGEVLAFAAPWSGSRPPPVDAAAVQALVADLAERAYDRCLVLTSFHQSPLPMALLARLAGVPFVAGTSEDYPGALLDVRHRRPHGLHEVEAALDLVRATGVAVASGTHPLAVRGPLPDVAALVGTGAVAGPDGHPGSGRPYVVLHPGASVPSRALSGQHAAAIARALADAGHGVVVTGGPGETGLTAAVVAAATQAGPAATRTPPVVDLGGRTTFAELAAVLAGASCVVVGNTGPAHLAAAVGTPVVSLFSPVVPADRWAPWGVPTVLLGDQAAPCRDTRARECPVAGHPCLTSVAPSEVVDAVAALTGRPAGVADVVVEAGA